MADIPAETIQRLLNEPTNHTYNEFSLIGSSCQHVHVHRLDDHDYQLILHIFTLLSFLFNLFSLYSIFFKSSKSMGNFKWCLMNLQFWTGMSDLMLSFFTAPRFYFPIIGGRPFGIFAMWSIPTRIQIYIGFGCFGAMIASVTVLFTYRHQVSIGEDNFLKISVKYLTVFIVVNYFLYVNMTLPAVLNSPVDQLAARFEILRREPCPPKDLLHPSVFILQSDFYFFLPWYLFLLVFVGTECGLMALQIVWVLIFSTFKQRLSKRTRMLQIKLFAALAGQIAIPTTLCYAPIFYLMITTFLDHYWQFANDICVFVFTTHGMISAICLILFYDCYRENLLYLLCRHSISKSRVSTHARNSILVTSMV